MPLSLVVLRSVISASCFLYSRMSSLKISSVRCSFSTSFLMSAAFTSLFSKTMSRWGAKMVLNSSASSKASASESLTSEASPWYFSSATSSAMVMEISMSTFCSMNTLSLSCVGSLITAPMTSRNPSRMSSALDWKSSTEGLKTSSSSSSITISIWNNGDACFSTTSSSLAEGCPSTSKTPPTEAIRTSCRVSQIM